MVIYEVNVVVQPEIAEEYPPWLYAHVEAMLTLPGFVAGTVLREEYEGTEQRFVVHYRVESRQALERYFSEHAERMRSDGLRRFGNKMSATRRILLG